MDATGPELPNYRNMARPLCMLSLIYFLVDIIVLSFLLDIIVGTQLAPVLPGQAGFALVSSIPIAAGGLVIVISAAGTLLILQEMRKQALNWKTAIPLSVLIIVLIILTLVSLNGSFQYDLYLTLLAVYVCLPVGAASLLRAFPAEESAPVRSFAGATGIFGMAAAGLLLGIHLAVSWWMAGLETVFVVVVLLCVFQVIFLMPMLGVKMYRLGIAFSTIPPEAVSAGPDESRPKKGIPEILRDLRNSVSPRGKRAILIVIAIILIAATCSVYMDITDTTPGRIWTLTNDSAPFLLKSGFTSIEYRGNLWMIGGDHNEGPDGEAWYTPDGIIWNHVSSPSMVPQRIGATSAVFLDGLWVIGGLSTDTNSVYNDVWYSGDGQTWWEMQHTAAFPPRYGHGSAVFGNRLWVIGGGTDQNGSIASDVWYSEDGKDWQLATRDAGFPARIDHSTLVYNNLLWVIGGRDIHGELNDVWNSADGIHWSKLTDSAYPERTAYRAEVFDGRIWLFGNKGILWSRDGKVWTKVSVSSSVPNELLQNHSPPVVFGNRLWIVRSGDRPPAGVWYTMPSGT